MQKDANSIKSVSKKYFTNNIGLCEPKKRTKDANSIKSVSERKEDSFADCDDNGNVFEELAVPTNAEEDEWEGLEIGDLKE